MHLAEGVVLGGRQVHPLGVREDLLHQGHRDVVRVDEEALLGRDVQQHDVVDVARVEELVRPVFRNALRLFHVPKEAVRRLVLDVLLCQDVLPRVEERGPLVGGQRPGEGAARRGQHGGPERALQSGLERHLLPPPTQDLLGEALDEVLQHADLLFDLDPLLVEPALLGQDLRVLHL